jgi:protein O-mannosyl-transferase
MRRTQGSAYYLAAFVSFITFTTYLPSLQNGFVNWDDNSYVFENPHIRSLNISFLRWAFFDFYADNWHPLTWLSHAADYAMWGLNPLGHHLTNIIIHAVNTFMVVLLIIRLFGDATEIAAKNSLSSFWDERKIFIAGGVTGLLFGLHPLHVESVAWIAERKDLLCAFFFLLGISAYTKYAGGLDSTTVLRRPAALLVKKQYLLLFGFTVLALMSKPMAVSLPVVLLILDWYPYKRILSLKTLWSAFVEKIPIIAACLISSVLTILAQKAGGTVVSRHALPLSVRVLVAARSLIVYLWKMILPLDLIPYYPYPLNVSLLSLEYLSAIALVIGITVCVLLLAKTRKLWFSAWGYYVATLIPVIGICQVGNQAMADRYTYLPSLGPFLLVGVSAAWVSRKLDNVRTSSGIAKRVFMGAGIVAFLTISSLTLLQIRIWRNDLALWNYIIEKEPERIFFAYNNRAAAFYKRGQIDKAIADYSKAIALDPTNEGVYNNRGMVYASQKKYDRAIADFETAIELNPGDNSGYYNMACLYALSNNTEEACKWLRKTIRKGYNDRQHIEQDPDFHNIRNAPCYKEIMAGRHW